MIIVDSSVWIDALHGRMNRHSIWLRDAIGVQPLGLTTLNVCEVLQGTRHSAQFDAFMVDLLKFPVYEASSTRIAVSAARNFQTLRGRGITVRKTIDCLVATFCIENNHQLLHRDRDFDAFEKHLGLRVLHPPALSAN